MQIMEAMVSLIFLVSFLSIAAIDTKAKGTDDSLYKYYLANDVWRILYLRGDFKDISLSSESLGMKKAENDLKIIGKNTGLCIFIGGERITNCRGEPTEKITSVERIMVIEGEPQKVMVTVAVYKGHA